MGKIYTFIHKDCQNSKVRTSEIQKYLDDGWQLGNWNQQELNHRSGLGVKRKYEQMRADGSYDEYARERNSKVSDGLKTFYKSLSNDGDYEQYINQREQRRLASRENWSDEYKSEIHQKMSNSAIKDRQCRTKEQYAEISARSIVTKKIHGTLNTSQVEEQSHCILQRYFDDGDIKRQYRDSRYPFNCDFYIISQDLFIECNYHWTHGGHPFDPNSVDDLLRLQQIRSKQKILPNGKKNFYYVCEDVWTIRDVNKFKYASTNKLKYITAYSIQELERELNKYEIQ